MPASKNPIPYRQGLNLTWNFNARRQAERVHATASDRTAHRVLREGRKSANTHVSLGFIRGIRLTRFFEVLETDSEKFENVDLESPFHLNELCEKTYILNIIKNLKRRMNNFEDFKFIIFSPGSGSESAPVNLDTKEAQKTVVLFISDETSLVPFDLCKKVKTVFKSYLPSEQLLPNLFSLPLGFVDTTLNLESIPINERKYDLFFSGNLNENRLELFKVVTAPAWSPIWSKQSYIKFTDGFRKGLDGAEYSRMLVNSKIVICPFGFRSPETFRHFEAMRAGAIIVSEKLPPLNFYRNSPIIILDDWRHLKDIARQLLSDKENLKQRQIETLKWYQNKCSEEAVASQVIDAIS